MVDGNGNECIDGMADSGSTAMSASMVDINGRQWAMVVSDHNGDD